MKEQIIDDERDAIEREEQFKLFVCDLCPKKGQFPTTFDSERGYKIHMSKVHKVRAEPKGCVDVMQRISDHLDENSKRGTSDDIVEKLTESVRRVKVKSESGEHPAINELQNNEEEMAAKKKVSAKKKSAPKKAAAPREPGRERKMLLRLSNAEYSGLEKLAKEKGISMAACLRSVIR